MAVARQAKAKHITYLSVYQAERFPNVPHFIGKYAVETSLKAFDTPFTVLRPGYFFQNDAQLKPVLTGAGLYPNPIGKAGIAAVARVLLGLVYFVFGLNGFLHWFPLPTMKGAAAEFMGGLVASGYFFPLLFGTYTITGGPRS
jgi:uncharacterized protein YbjT (DUF2867 family)